LNDAKRGCRIVIMQRGHQTDLAQYLIETGMYEHLNLPNEFVKSKRCTTSIGWTDPRTTRGSCCARSGSARRDRRREGDRRAKYSTQYQQNPVPPDGTLFKVAEVDRAHDRSARISRQTSSSCARRAAGTRRRRTRSNRRRKPDWTAGVKISKLA
jgi:hypothetical protein